MKKATPVKSTLIAKESEASLERTTAELRLPDPSPEQATAVFKHIKEEDENAQPGAAE